MNARPDAIILFGATGDLARRKLFPALYRLWRDDDIRLPIVGVARSDWSDDDLVDRARQALDEAVEDVDGESFAGFAAALTYVRGDYDDDALFARIRDALGAARAPLAFLSVPPGAFATVVRGLDDAGLAEHGGVVVEKPFGRDLASARELNEVLHSCYPESSIFRIDHFLGKEPVQNILITRFANGIFEPIWDRRHVSHVQITMAETLDVGERGAFYDGVGTLRDVVQNHLLQLVALLAMEPPVSADADALRDEVTKVLRSITRVRPEQVVWGQYDGYRDHRGVDPESTTETFVALRLEIDTWRWAGVPFYIRAGKAMRQTFTEAVVEFQSPPRPLFADDDCGSHPNHLRFRVKPTDETALHLQAKLPGERLVGRGVELKMSVQESFGEGPEAYERLLNDAIRGDARLFARQDTVEEAWRVFADVLDPPGAPEIYERGSWGPAAADDVLLEGHHWHSMEPFEGVC